MHRRWIPLLIALVVASGIAARERERGWTDSSGKHTTRATFLSSADGKVELRTSDGRRISVPLDRLSAADQTYVRDAIARAPKVLIGEVIAITDGDTLTVLDAEKQQHKIRLEGIDAPENHQDFGARAKVKLGEKAFRRQIRVEWREKDKYGRTLGHIYVGDRWVNKELVEEGWAWHYKQYSKDEELATAERVAQGKKLGLWQGKDPIAPWDFRRGVRPEIEKKVAASPRRKTERKERRPTEKAAPAVFVTRTGKKYHLDGCRYLAKSKIPISLADAERGYGACSVCKPPHSNASRPSPSKTKRQNSAVVYATKTGSKYHRAGRRYLSRSQIPISLDEAKARYSPCSVCKPPS